MPSQDLLRREPEEEIGEAESFVESPSVGAYVESYFADVPIMAKVAWCESRHRQFDQHGDILRGRVNSLDVGVMQINEHYHLKRSRELGLDLYTLEGNLSYARILFEEQGTTPWLSSSPCWGKENHIAKR